MDGTLQVVGLTRFSYPANLEAFQTRHPDMAARRAALYATERLETRFFLFESFLLPAIRAQTHPGFTLLVLMGDDFPEPWRSRMLDLIGGVPQIRPVFHETAPHREVYRKVLRAARDPAVPLLAEFRLDDDDAVAVDFVEQLHGLLPRMREFVAESGRAALDFRRGVVVTPEPSGGIGLSGVLANLWAPALAVYSRSRAPGCVMDIQHQRLWQHMPTVGLNAPVMFLRGQHATNDSRIEMRGCGSFEPDQGFDALLADRFAVDAATARSRWAGLQAAAAGGC